MLVLTRKKGEAIQIGDNVALRVLSIQGNRVRLGIDAPANVDVRRAELVLELDLSHCGQQPSEMKSEIELAAR